LFACLVLRPLETALTGVSRLKPLANYRHAAAPVLWLNLKVLAVFKDVKFGGVVTLINQPVFVDATFGVLMVYFLFWLSALSRQLLQINYSTFSPETSIQNRAADKNLTSYIYTSTIDIWYNTTNYALS
jgi:hypothetical protein